MSTRQKNVEDEPRDIALDRCANGSCSEVFKRFSEGQLFMFPVKNPVAWGLPPGATQKLYWLCDGCKKNYSLHIDRGRKKARVVPRESRFRPAAHNI
jgi:hypothetical protein